MYDIYVIIDGKKVLAQVDANEVSRVANEITWAELTELVTEEINSGDYGIPANKTDLYIAGITREVKSAMVDDRLSVDEVEEDMLQRIIKEYLAENPF